MYLIHDYDPATAILLLGGHGGPGQEPSPSCVSFIRDFSDVKKDCCLFDVPFRRSFCPPCPLCFTSSRARSLTLFKSSGPGDRSAIGLAASSSAKLMASGILSLNRFDAFAKASLLSFVQGSMFLKGTESVKWERENQESSWYHLLSNVALKKHPALSVSDIDSMTNRKHLVRNYNRRLCDASWDPPWPLHWSSSFYAGHP